MEKLKRKNTKVYITKKETIPRKLNDLFEYVKNRIVKNREFLIL